MLSVDDALAICRVFAAMSGDPPPAPVTLTPDQFDRLATSMERLLVEVQLARDEADHYRAQLKEWGIPAKRRTLKRLENGGFEAGWE